MEPTTICPPFMTYMFPTIQWEEFVSATKGHILLLPQLSVAYMYRSFDANIDTIEE